MRPDEVEHTPAEWFAPAGLVPMQMPLTLDQRCTLVADASHHARYVGRTSPQTTKGLMAGSLAPEGGRSQLGR